MKDWEYYNHAVIPTCAPHETPDLSSIIDGTIWNERWGGGKSALLARWTEDFDCGYETNWWYVIKDSPFDIASLKSKRRYEINKGLKTFEVRKIKNISEYADQIFTISKDAYEGYPKSYRPKIMRDEYIAGVNSWSGYDFYGAFSKEDGMLKAWARLKPYTDYSSFEMMKAIRSQEKLGVNTALIYGILEDYNPRLVNGYYICDGSRSINHETKFQDFLEKYFNFRKVFCKLHIQYNPKIRYIVKMIYPFRKIIKRIQTNSTAHKISVILQMEEIARKDN